MSTSSRSVEEISDAYPNEDRKRHTCTEKFFCTSSFVLMGLLICVAAYTAVLKVKDTEMQDQLRRYEQYGEWDPESDSEQPDGYGDILETDDDDDFVIDPPGDHKKPAVRIQTMHYERLLNATKPLSYELLLTVYLTDYATTGMSSNIFTGRLHVTVEVMETTNIIEMHGVPFTILRAHMFQEEKERELAWAYGEYDKLAFGDGRPIEPGIWTLAISYSDKMVEGNQGFHQVLLRDPKTLKEGLMFRSQKGPIDQKQNKVRTAAVSNFKPSLARKMVPCFDEPALKAPWTVSIIHPKGTRALSNGLETRHRDIKVDGQSGWERTTFEKTMPISTYLLSVFVGDMPYRASTTSSGVVVRVFAQGDGVAYADFALRTATKLVEELRKFIGLEFPLRKLDFLALPDLPYEASESPGLVTMLESDLLIVPDASVHEKQRVARAIGHQVAMQWVGNLVNINMFSDTWLPESLALWLELNGLELLDHGFNAQSEMVRMQDLAFLTDFDRKIYQPRPEKGAAFIHMLYRTMGYEDFFKSFRNFFQDNLYGSSDAEKFWSEFAASSAGSTKIRVKELVDEWMYRPGFPLLILKQDEDANSKKYSVSIERFSFDPKVQQRGDALNNDVEYAPFYYSSGKITKIADFPRGEIRASIVPEGFQPIAINLESETFARTLYFDAGYGKRLLTDKSAPILTPLTRARVLSDVFYTSDFGFAWYNDTLDIAKDLLLRPRHAQEIVFLKDQILEFITRFKRSEDFMAVSNGFFAMVNDVRDSIDIQKVIELNKDVKNTETVQLAMAYIELECATNPRACTKTWTQVYQKNLTECKGMFSECTKIAPIFRPLVYCNLVKSGDSSRLDMFWNALEREEVQSERDRLIQAYGCTRQWASVHRFLDIALAGLRGLRPHDAKVMIDSLDGIQSKLFDYFRNNYEYLEGKYTSAPALYSDIISGLLKNMNEDQVTELKELLTRRTYLVNVVPFDLQIMLSERRQLWLQTYRKTIIDYFAKLKADRLAHPEHFVHTPTPILKPALKTRP